MAQGSSPLHEEILARIRRGGPISFAEYMERCLYHPEWGYYARADRIGRGGDYLTSPETHPAFGRLIGRRVAGLLAQAGSEEGVVCEVGAGSGALAQGILAELSEQGLDQARYVIAEPISAWRALQAERLAAFDGRVSWINSLAGLEAGSLRGVIVTNELLDALPVHRVVNRRGVLREVLVASTGDRLTEREGEPTTPALGEYFAALGLLPCEGGVVEVNLAAVAWLRRAARVLEKGTLLTMDYGGTAAELYTQPAKAGTLRTYRAHQSGHAWLERPGEQDLTADVDFTTLRRVGEALGLRAVTDTSQREYLLRLGWREWLTRRRTLARDGRGRFGSLLALVDPRTQGRVRVLEQVKDP